MAKPNPKSPGTQSPIVDFNVSGGQMLHSFFMQAPALLCILKGPGHTFEMANPIYQQFTGNRSLEGKQLLEALPELQGQGFSEILDKVYQTGEPFIGNEMPVSIDIGEGKIEVYYLNVNYQAFKNEAGQTEGILVFAYDVTREVNSRKQLELNAEMINNLYMNAPAYLCTFTGPKHIYTLVNPSYQKLFGKRVIVNKPILEALPELVGQGFDTILDNVYQTGEVYVGIEVLIWLARDEGLPAAERYFNFSYQPIYDLDKKITGILVFGYEVTEEVLSRKMQKDVEARFLTLTDAMPQKVWTADATGRVTYLNKLWFEFTQQNFDRLKDWGWEGIIHPEDIESYKQAWQHSINTSNDFRIEQRFLHHDGTFRWHLSLGVAQKDEEGNVILWLGTHTDIHAQKSQAEELKLQVEERTKTEKLKNEFISMASHELKTPVTSIKGYTQALQHKFKMEGNTVAEGFLAKMDKQVNKLTSLINDLLDSAKVSAGQLQITEEWFDFNELINEIVEEMQRTSKKITLETFLGKTAMLYGDRNRIGQVITNMLSNAIKYSPKANHVIITTLNKNQYIKFSVQDFGVGIPKENQAHVFDQFFRVSGFIQDTFAGLGLGLFIASEIIKRHHGTIAVESEEGEGSTFSFTLPLTKQIQHN